LLPTGCSYTRFFLSKTRGSHGHSARHCCPAAPLLRSLLSPRVTITCQPCSFCAHSPSLPIAAAAVAALCVCGRCCSCSSLKRAGPDPTPLTEFSMPGHWSYPSGWRPSWTWERLDLAVGLIEDNLVNSSGSPFYVTSGPPLQRLQAPSSNRSWRCCHGIGEGYLWWIFCLSYTRCCDLLHMCIIFRCISMRKVLQLNSCL
jgi:hypothetical protein